MNEQRMWRVDTVLLREAYNNIFAPCSSYFDIRKEVINKMAIDYKKEWEKLQSSHGKCLLDSRKILHGPFFKLEEVMAIQISRTIDKREALMKEYVKEERITTEIDGGERHFYNVNVIDKAHGKTHWLIGTIHVHKADFNAWCKRKGGK